MEARDRAPSDAYYTHLRDELRRGAHVLAVASGTYVPLHFDWSFDYYPRDYVRPGTEVTVYRLRDCTPTTTTFPPDFVIRSGTAVDDMAVAALLAGPLRYPVMETTLERLDGDRIRIRVEVSHPRRRPRLRARHPRPREERRACPASGPEGAGRPRCAHGSARRRSSPRRSTATSAAGTAARSTRPASSPSSRPTIDYDGPPCEGEPWTFTAEVEVAPSATLPKKLVLEAPRHESTLPTARSRSGSSGCATSPRSSSPSGRARRDGPGGADRLRLHGERQEA